MTTLTDAFLLLLVGAAFGAFGARADDASAGDEPLKLQGDVSGVELSLTPRAMIRVRAEVLGARDLSGSDIATLLSHRARAGFVARAGEWTSLTLDLQDVRIWGSELSPAGSPADATLFDYSAGGLDLHQGFIGVHAGSLQVRVGRQEISVENERLVGAVDWTQQGRSFDAVHASMGGAEHGVSAFASQTSDDDVSTPAGPLVDSWLLGTHGSFSFLDVMKIAPIVLVDSHSGAGRLRWTTGARYHGALAGLLWDTEAYYQGASVSDGITTAFLLAASASYGLDTMFKPRAGALVDFVSGDTDPTSTEGVAAFDTLYATNHKFYGYADLFLNLPLHTAQQGLVDVALFAQTAEGPFSAKLSLHGFAAAYAADASSPLYGVEPDLTVNAAVGKHLSFGGGGALFVPVGDALGRGDQVMPWLFLQIAGTL